MKKIKKKKVKSTLNNQSVKQLLSLQKIILTTRKTFPKNTTLSR